MPITGNYINANERQNDQTGSAASVFTDILQNSLKRKQELEFEAQKADAEFKRNLHYKDLLNAANEAKSGSYNDNSELGRATRNVNNPTYAGTKVIKSPVTPPNAMMSLVSGAYGDAAGNPIAAMANGIGNENASAFQQLTNTAKEVIPQIQQDPRYTMEFDNGKFGIKDNQKEQDSFLEKAATAGVDPYENGRPKTRTQILSEMAKAKSMQDVSNINVPDGYELKRASSNGKITIEKVPSVSVAEKKFQADQIAKSEQNKNTKSIVADSAQQTLRTIQEIKNGLKYFGAMGNLPAFPAEYDKKNWEANFDRLKNKMVVDLMLQLKQASKTGATGFGNLSEKEGMRLEQASSALRKGLSEEDAMKYLKELEDSATRVLDHSSSIDNSSEQSFASDDPEYQRYLQAIGQ